MAYELPDLPYEYTALEPYISKQTLEFHHDQHHATYVDRYNAAIVGTSLVDRPIDAVIKQTTRDPSRTAIFNNAAQAWNHSFYWNCMKPDGGGQPTGALAKKIEMTFGSYEQFVTAFQATGVSQFGSGWIWLVLDRGALKIIPTSNADTPMIREQIPLLTLDVWEHAYYLDYQNRRAEYISVFLEKLVNWNFVATNLGAVW